MLPPMAAAVFPQESVQSTRLWGSEGSNELSTHPRIQRISCRPARCLRLRLAVLLLGVLLLTVLLLAALQRSWPGRHSEAEPGGASTVSLLARSQAERTARSLQSSPHRISFSHHASREQPTSWPSPQPPLPLRNSASSSSSSAQQSARWQQLQQDGNSSARWQNLVPW